MGEKRTNDNSLEDFDAESLPDNLNEDPWGQIAEHQDKLHKLEVQRKKQEKENTRNLVRQTLAN